MCTVHGTVSCKGTSVTSLVCIFFSLLQDLRNANSALANELARTRSACQEVFAHTIILLDELIVAPQSHCLLLAVQDLDSMRQDLATYASDIKSEQEHAVSMMQSSCAQCQVAILNILPATG